VADVLDAKHIGQGVIDGVDCEHLAFRNADVDWQIWVEVGARPVPRKYIITSKTITGAPQYTLRIKEWRADVPVAGDAFVFKPPADAKKVEVAALREIDEIPPGTTEWRKEMTKRIRLGLAAAAGFIVLFAANKVPQTDTLVATADARVGRPATPMSYAGAARRTTRQGAGAAAAYGSGCYQAVDDYGRVYAECL
jgi:Predicted periplasmic protein (DUF2092)